MIYWIFNDAVQIVFIAALNSVYRYFVFQEIGYQLPLMIFAVWFIALFVALTYYRGKGIYVVNEKGN